MNLALAPSSHKSVLAGTTGSHKQEDCERAGIGKFETSPAHVGESDYDRYGIRQPVEAV